MNKRILGLLEAAICDEYDTKFREIAKLWVRWNKKEITGDIFAERVQHLLHKETLREWNRQQNLSQDDDPLRKLLV